MPVKTAKKLVKKFDFIRFALVGVLNTILDFTILNTLVAGLGAPVLIANIISTSLTMIFSFRANQRLVFRSSSAERRHRQIILFISGTLFGLYVIQTLVIAALAHWWTGPLETLTNLLIGRSSDLLVINLAKAAATATTMIWNYFFYKFVVFGKSK
ncbi:GtrA family protein [Candidatus Saccharibacteria bacterium]|nr:GtrA family protein [Candidatus Saccharibacteria bacterium]MCB9821250.1 GtrA family protein [Candidatus Nomurabacteria bacterium]